MAIRIAQNVVIGEIDNRTRGRVTGFLELAEGAGRLTIHLVGNAHPDLAGSLLRFRNRAPEPLPPQSLIGHLTTEQTGRVGDMTASHRVKDLLVPLDTFLEMDEEARKSAFRWANCLYLEWFSEQHGRIVIEGIGFDLEVVEGPLWKLTPEELQVQAEATAEGMREFLSRVAETWEIEEALHGDDEVIPPAEAEIEAEMERMDAVTESMARRLPKEGCSSADWVRIYEEETARLRHLRGEPDPEALTPEEEEEQRRWIEEMNAAAEDALRDYEAETWKEELPYDHHPLVAACHELSLKVFHENIVPEDAHLEHPLIEIRDGLLLAAGKLAGALNQSNREDGWPPHEFAAPAVLIFLKKARSRLRDALLGLDSADEQNLASPEWRKETRQAIMRILIETQRLIQEARRVLDPDPDKEL